MAHEPAASAIARDDMRGAITLGLVSLGFAFAGASTLLALNDVERGFWALAACVVGGWLAGLLVKQKT